MKVLISFDISIEGYSFNQVAVISVRGKISKEMGKTYKQKMAKKVDRYMLDFYGSSPNDDDVEECNGSHSDCGRWEYEYFQGEIGAVVKEMRVITDEDYKVIKRLGIACI
jgi:hypothetical protein